MGRKRARIAVFAIGLFRDANVINFFYLAVSMKILLGTPTVSKSISNAVYAPNRKQAICFIHVGNPRRSSMPSNEATTP
jgi:hypothetical protein